MNCPTGVSLSRILRDCIAPTSLSPSLPIIDRGICGSPPKGLVAVSPLRIEPEPPDPKRFVVIARDLRHDKPEWRRAGPPPPAGACRDRREGGQHQRGRDGGDTCDRRHAGAGL